MCEGPRDVHFIFRGCTQRLCADICVAPNFCVHADLSACPLHCACVEYVSERTPETSIDRTATSPWCPQLSVYASVLKYIHPNKSQRILEDNKVSAGEPVEGSL